MCVHKFEQENQHKIDANENASSEGKKREGKKGMESK